MPWNQPLIIHSTPRTTSDVLKPKKMLTTAQHTRPNGMNQRAFKRSPKKPLTNFETPYTRPCSVRNRPNWPLVIPSLPYMIGAATLMFLRTK